MEDNLKLHEKYIKRCFALAKKGYGKTTPNPLVGCVVLDKNGNKISEGYHKKYGEFHAERDALSKIKLGEAIGGTLYVNLEPCSHYGKTPPCTDIIIEHGIKKVVYAMDDVNPKVCGSKILQRAGIKVIKGVLEEEAKFLNRIFIKNIIHKMPYVVLKTATTMDGKIATKTGSSKWITSDKARKEVYKMRQNFDCIMTSSKTILVDNPKMKHKFKCILDTDNKIPKDALIYNQGEFYIATKENTPTNNGFLDIKTILKNLYQMGICSVFLECGGTLAGNMLKEGLIDEIYQFIAPKILNDNTGLSCFNGNNITDINSSVNLSIYEIKKLYPDVLIKAIVK